MTRILTVVFVLSLVNTAVAQQPRVGYRPRPRSPVTSPYLNLLRGNGRSTAFNYFQRVRPEQEFRRNAMQFDRSLDSLQQQVATQERRIREETGLTTTGHRAVFQSVGSYFPGLPGSGSRLGSGSGGRPASRAPAGRSRR